MVGRRCIDTGADTGTAGRVLGCAGVLGDTFMATYGDGLGAVDLGALVGFHRRHRGAVTVTTVPLPSPYGTIEWDEAGRVRGFLEKPRLADHWINAGFFVFDAAGVRPLGRATTSSAMCCRPWVRRESCSPTGTTASGGRWTPTKTRSS